MSPVRCCIFFSILCIISEIGVSWHKPGIGKVDRLITAPSADTHDIIVSSEKGVLARLTVDKLTTVWRQPPLGSHDAFESISILDGRFLVAHVKRGTAGEYDAQIVRVHKVKDGKFVWDKSACGIGKATDSKLIVVRTCGSQETLKAINLEDGNEMESSSIDSDSVEWIEGNSGMGTDNLDPIERVWQINQSSKQGSTSKIEVVSSMNGRISVRENESRDELVSRHEGASHSIDALFIDAILGSATGMEAVVVLSEFGTLFSYDLEDEGNTRWVAELPVSVDNPSQQRCKLAGNQKNTIASVCVYKQQNGQSNSVVTFTNAMTGDHLLIKNIEDFGAVQSFFTSQCCTAEDACLQLTNSEAKSRIISTCMSQTVDETKQWMDDRVIVSARHGSELMEGFRNERTLWRQRLPAGLRLAGVALKRPIHSSSRTSRLSAVQVTGDRRLLWKFTDASIILALAEHTDHSNGAMMAMLLDGNSGSVLKVVNHANASAPFSAVGCDNWFVYSFWNTFLLQQELHVIDMYKPELDMSFIVKNIRDMLALTYPPALNLMERLLPATKVHDDSAGTCSINGDGTQTCTAESNSVQPAPELLCTSFLLSHQVVGLQYSETEGGITERSVLFALSNGQVVSLSRLAVDARRPKGNMASSESLMPYYPYISFLPSDSSGVFVTRDTYLAGLQGIAVAPVKWKESTCDVVAFGVDLYYRRLQPAGSFDTLPDDFGFSADLEA